MAVRLRREARRSAAVAAAVAFLAGAPAEGRAQSAESLPTRARVRVDLHGTERSLLRRPVAQPIAGSLLGWRGDTLLLSLSADAEPLRVPRATIAALHVSRGRSGRLESAVRRAVVPTLASAALNAQRASLSSGGPSPGEAAVSAAGRTVAVTATLGFLLPRERWSRVSLPPPPPPSGGTAETEPETAGPIRRTP